MSDEETSSGPHPLTQGADLAVGHEFDSSDRTGAHRLVATGMLVTFLVIAISQNWWTHLRDYIATKTHGPAAVTPPGGGTPKP